MYREDEYMGGRKQISNNKEEVIFSAAPKLSEISDDYLDFIEEIKNS